MQRCQQGIRHKHTQPQPTASTHNSCLSCSWSAAAIGKRLCAKHCINGVLQWCWRVHLCKI